MNSTNKGFLILIVTLIVLKIIFSIGNNESTNNVKEANIKEDVNTNNNIERVNQESSNLGLVHSGKLAQAAYSLGNGQWSAMPIQIRNVNNVVCAYYDDSWKPCWYVIEADVNNKITFVHNGRRYLIGKFK